MRFDLNRVRTGGASMCECGFTLAYHEAEPAYYGAERFGKFMSVAEREADCTRFRFKSESYREGFRRRFEKKED